MPSKSASLHPKNPIFYSRRPQLNTFNYKEALKEAEALAAPPSLVERCQKLEAFLRKLEIKTKHEKLKKLRQELQKITNLINS